MLPSSAQPEPKKGSQLRRWGPLALVVVLVAVVVIVVVANNGNDNNKQASTNTTAAANGTVTPTDAISFQQAKDQGLKNPQFQKGCDTSTGRAAMPYYFANPCYVTQPNKG